MKSTDRTLDVSAQVIVDYPFEYAPLQRKAFWSVLKSLYVVEKEAGTLFLFGTLAVAIGAIAYFSLNIMASWLDIVFLLLSGFCILQLCFFHAFTRLIALCLCCTQLGFSAAKWEEWRVGTKMLARPVITHIVAEVADIKRNAKGCYHVQVKIRSTAAPALSYVPKYVRLFAYHLPQELEIGDDVKGCVKLYPLSSAAYPGGYDFAFFSYFKGVGAGGIFLGTPQKMIGSARDYGIKNFLLHKIAQWRHSITLHLHNMMPGESGIIAAALITGERSSISPQTNEALRQAGLAHILAISGLHMAMIVGLVFAAMRWLLSLWVGFALRYPIKKIAALFALVAAQIYLLLSGTAIAAQRSCIMVSLALLLCLCDRAVFTLRNFAYAFLFIIIFWPHELLDPAFQMSFAATGALGAAFSLPFFKQKKRPYSEEPVGKIKQFLCKLGQLFLSVAQASFVAGLASGIFSAYHFHNFALFGVVSNLLVVPLMSFVVMPAALMGLLLLPVGAAGWPFCIMDKGIIAIKKIAFFVSSFSPVVNPGYMSPAVLALFAFGLSLFIVLRTSLRWVSLFFILLGLGLYWLEDAPELIIAENGKLAAYLAEKDALSLSAKRRVGFLVHDWAKGFNKKQLFYPMRDDNEEGANPCFVCKEGVCWKQLEDKSFFYYIPHAVPADAALQQRMKQKPPSLVFLNFFTLTPRAYAPLPAQLLSAKEVALYGSVALFPRGKLVWAAGEPVHGWNSYRQFSDALDGY